ncbi:MAG: tRNA-binding protein [Saprospiraceae bacterium]|nr:tRNA-binding protein [Saprospiraceae bacterium]
MEKITWEDFIGIDMRVGTIIKAEVFVGARKPAYKLLIDFGDLGLKKSSAQITKNYSTTDLQGRQILAVVNFPIKQIGTFMSECLVLCAMDRDNNMVLISPERVVSNGLKIG